jgi:hypothetical protein
LLDALPFLGGRLLIEGAAGSGKSTLLRWTAIQAADEVKSGEFDLSRYYWHNFALSSMNKYSVNLGWDFSKELSKNKFQYYSIDSF